MTPKERAAMQQALEALEELHYSSGTVVAARMYEIATAALRAALAEQSLQKLSDFHQMMEQQPVAWMLEGSNCVEFEYRDYHDGYEWTPLYAAPVQPVQQAEQEPVAWKDMAFAKLGVVRDKMLPEDVAVVQRFLDGDYAAPQPVSQEPVAYYIKFGRRVSDGMQVMFGDDEILYAAPVRTKDLTDDEILSAWGSVTIGCGVSAIKNMRAVIAADREKNK